MVEHTLRFFPAHPSSIAGNGGDQFHETYAVQVQDSAKSFHRGRFNKHGKTLTSTKASPEPLSTKRTTASTSASCKVTNPCTHKSTDCTRTTASQKMLTRRTQVDNALRDQTSGLHTNMPTQYTHDRHQPNEAPDTNTSSQHSSWLTDTHTLPSLTRGATIKLQWYLTNERSAQARRHNSRTLLRDFYNWHAHRYPAFVDEGNQHIHSPCQDEAASDEHSVHDENQRQQSTHKNVNNTLDIVSGKKSPTPPHQATQPHQTQLSPNTDTHTTICSTDKEKEGKHFPAHTLSQAQTGCSKVVGPSKCLFE